MAYKILRPIANLVDFSLRVFYKFVSQPLYKSRLGYCGKGVEIRLTGSCKALNRVYMYDKANLSFGFQFISYSGKFIMKKNSGSAANLTVITGNHGKELGRAMKDVILDRTGDVEKDVIVEEDAWIGSDVVLLPGVIVGRGATVGAGSVVRTNIPPYAITAGNPCKVVGFNFTPEQIIEHEKVLYPEEERLPLELLEKNYKKYFLDRMKEIRSFTSL